MANRSDWPDDLALDFDGACWPNPGGVASYGWVIRDNADETILHSGQGVVTETLTRTNNVAEWFGLVSGLNALLNASWSGSLLIRGDSMLVIRQLLKAWLCKKPNFAMYRDGCLGVLVEICPGKTWRAEWMPREQNADADKLSRIAYTAKTGADLPV